MVCNHEIGSNTKIIVIPIKDHVTMIDEYIKKKVVAPAEHGFLPLYTPSAHGQLHKYCRYDAAHFSDAEGKDKS